MSQRPSVTELDTKISTEKVYGNVPPTDIFQISIEKSTFSVEIFVSRNTALGLWDMSNTSATS